MHNLVVPSSQQQTSPISCIHETGGRPMTMDENDNWFVSAQNYFKPSAEAKNLKYIPLKDRKCCHAISFLGAVLNGCTNADAGVDSGIWVADVFGMDPSSCLTALEWLCMGGAVLSKAALSIESCAEVSWLKKLAPNQTNNQPLNDEHRRLYNTHVRGSTCGSIVKLSFALAAALPSSIFAYTGLYALLAPCFVSMPLIPMIGAGMVAASAFIPATFSYYKGMESGMEYIYKTLYEILSNFSCGKMTILAIVGLALSFFCYVATLGRVNALLTFLLGILKFFNVMEVSNLAWAGLYVASTVAGIANFLLYLVGLCKLYEHIAALRQFGDHLPAGHVDLGGSISVAFLLSLTIALPASIGSGVQVQNAILNILDVNNTQTIAMVCGIIGAVVSGVTNAMPVFNLMFPQLPPELSTLVPPTPPRMDYSMPPSLDTYNQRRLSVSRTSNSFYNKVKDWSAYLYCGAKSDSFESQPIYSQPNSVPGLTLHKLQTIRRLICCFDNKDTEGVNSNLEMLVPYDLVY